MYIALLIWIISFKCNLYQPVSESLIILPKKTLYERFIIGIPSIKSIPHILKNIDFWRNIILFMPLGIYLPLITDRVRALSGTLIAFSMSLTFEIIQLFTCIGGFTLDDLFANTVGFLIGYVIFKKANPKLPDKAIDLINVAIIIIATPFFLYALPNTIINWEIYTIEYYHG